MHYDTKQPKTKNAKRTIHMIEPLAKEFEEYKEKLLQWKAENGFVHSEDDFVLAKSTPDLAPEPSIVIISKY